MMVIVVVISTYCQRVAKREERGKRREGNRREGKKREGEKQRGKRELYTMNSWQEVNLTRSKPQCFLERLFFRTNISRGA
jgi:hypothetical protein